MTQTEIESKAVGLIASFLKTAPERVGLGDRLREDLGADSLDLVELFFEFEQVFDVLIPDARAVEIKTVGDAVLAVEEAVRR